MRTAYRGGLLPALIALLAAAAAAFLAPVPAVAAHRLACPTVRQQFPLHAGSCGQHVADLQWILGGHRPYVFRQVKPTFKGKPNGSYGARTKHDVLAMKYRVGYPAKGQCGAKTTLLRDTTSRYFFFILEGKAKRPTCWVGLAAERVKGAVRTGPTRTALAIQKLEVAQLGVAEQPGDGRYNTNRGPRISYSSAGYGPYQGSTGAYDEAWCASFAEWALIRVTGHGFGSTNDAYVPTIAEYAQARNLLAAKPRVGSFVIFLSSNLQLVNAFHIGYVVRVTATGVQTIEGNEGNAVREVWRAYAANHMVYVNVPGVA
jgi:hypothetical protein